MDGPRDVILSEVSQTGKDRFHSTYMWNLKKEKNTSELIYKTEIESQM